MKQRIRLTESTLNKIIKESVNKSLKRMLGEGATADLGLSEKWDYAIRILTPQCVLDAIWNYLSSDQLEQIIEWLDDDYQLFD